MTLEDLLEEGRRLARRCLYLRPDGNGPIVGYRDGECAHMPNLDVTTEGELTDVGGEYEQEFFDLASYYTHKDDIMIGGWHMQWPSDMFFMPREMRILVTAKEPGRSVWELWLTPGRNEWGCEQIPGGMA